MFISECLPLFLLSFFGPPTFSMSLFLSISLSLSLSLYLSLSLVIVFLSSFLSLFFAFFWLLVFCLFLGFSFLFAFVSCKEQHQNIQLQSFIFFSNPFSLFGFLSCFLFQIPFTYLSFFFFFFLILSYDFCSTSMFFWVSKPTSLKHNCLVKRGVTTELSFMNLCCKM